MLEVGGRKGGGDFRLASSLEDSDKGGNLSFLAVSPTAARLKIFAKTPPLEDALEEDGSGMSLAPSLAQNLCVRSAYVCWHFGQ
ncbi:MAG: hypothetical protein M3033_14230 [Acidobacteriota bacterium]|nr:hypothetical protein [Acidobacteriota bacterium]